MQNVLRRRATELMEKGVPEQEIVQQIDQLRTEADKLQQQSVELQQKATERQKELLQELAALDATLSARLFNATGRRRGSMQDCMIAAVAIRSSASLATNNALDFRRFVAHGLTIVSR